MQAIPGQITDKHDQFPQEDQKRVSRQIQVVAWLCNDLTPQPAAWLTAAMLAGIAKASSVMPPCQEIEAIKAQVRGCLASDISESMNHRPS